MEETSDLSDFDRGMIVAARRLGRSSTETGKLLGFSRATVAKVYKEWCKEQKTSSKEKSDREYPVNEKGPTL